MLHPTPARCPGRLLAAAACLALAIAAPGHAARLRVCTFSFHTPAEVEAFRSMLPADDFEIVDLTPDPFQLESAAAADAGRPSHEGFPLNLCRPDLRCDVLVIAGEFAGRFFGKTGASLGLQEMDEAACQTRCRGLFHDPREVFLLACNTLATKDQDRRTPGEYLQVLLDHGFDHAAAERVVELRYGPLGQSFRESLRRVFMGVPRLYGFSTVAPVGETTGPMLVRYLRDKGDYARYLERTDRHPTPNRELLGAFRGTGLVQTTGLSVTERGAADREEICALYDESRGVVDRLRVAQRMLERKDPLSFLPAIDVFVSRHPPHELDAEGRAVFAAVQANQAARTQVLDLVRDLDVSALKLEIAHLARQLEWLSAAEFRALAVDGARRLLARPLTSEVVDVTCEITKHESIGDAFSAADLPPTLLGHAEGFRLVYCLAPPGDAVSARLAEGLGSEDITIRAWAAHALTRRLPLEDALVRRVAERLFQDPSPDVRERLQWILRVQAPLPDDVYGLVRAQDPKLGELLLQRRRRF